MEALSLLEVVWHGCTSAAELRTALEEIADFLKQKQVSYFLVDARLLNAVKATDEVWVRTYLMPMLASTYIRRLARVAHQHTFINQNIENNILDRIAQEQLYSFSMKVFEERENALDWLFSYEAA